MSTDLAILDDAVDEHVDVEIDQCLDLDKPTSFFLFAGAGSGKTRSLVRALSLLRIRSGEQMRLRGQQVAVITYTNAACDEITRRLEFDPLVNVQTIHSFVWDLIRGFDADIKTWLRSSIANEINAIEQEEAKGRPGTKASIERKQKIIALQKRQMNLGNIRRFIYSPTGENRTRDSLGHAEVIKIGSDFLGSKPLMQELLVSKHPVLLIDESQDTNKALLDSLFVVQATRRQSFCLGLIGDVMQRIYTDGKVNLGQDLPADWKRPSKTMNHRCPHRVIRLINKIRSTATNDNYHQQRGRTDANEGHARFFIAQSTGESRGSREGEVRRQMAAITGDSGWSHDNGVKVLILEHHMAAQRLEFSEMFGCIDVIPSFKTALRDGSLPFLKLFADLVLPLVRAKLAGSEFTVASIVRTHSPLLNREVLSSAGSDQPNKILAAKTGVEDLLRLFDNSATPTFLTVLRSIAQTGLFEIPDSLSPFLTDVKPTEEEEEPQSADGDESATKSLEAIRRFLDTSFWQIAPYTDYVHGRSSFATHQGVKGLEFPRVLVVMDDERAGGFLFSFEKLFGAKEKTSADIKNEQSGADSTVERTRRLFYVTCSRSESSLALLAYTSNPSKVQATLVDQGWFSGAEIELLH